LRDQLYEELPSALALSGDPLPDALFDVVQRDLRRVQPVRLRFRLRFRHETPPAFQRVLVVWRDAELCINTIPTVKHYHKSRPQVVDAARGACCVKTRIGSFCSKARACNPRASRSCAGAEAIII
jgi:hypothetical protein